MKSILAPPLRPCGARVALAHSASAVAQNFGPPELIEAAKKEGKLVYYTANFTEVEQEMIKAFNKRFPFVKVELVRAPGGQLITRVKTEAAAGKLAADVVDHSDRGLMLATRRPVPGLCAAQRRRLPRRCAGLAEAVAARHPGLVDRLQRRAGEEPAEVVDGPRPSRNTPTSRSAQVFAPSGGTTWTRAMFERQVLGEDYWAKQAATKPVLYPSGAPLADALVRGEVSIAPSLYNIVYHQEARRRAARDLLRRPKARRPPPTPPAFRRPPPIPTPPSCSSMVPVGGGQTFMIKEQGNLTSLKKAPVYPRRLRSQGGEGVAAELRAVREAARELDRGVEQDLRLSAVDEAISARFAQWVRDGLASSTVDAALRKVCLRKQSAGRRSTT